MHQNLRRKISSPNALFVFEACARLNSFRGAASELNVTQPSISYQIKNLEDHLETKLFRRHGRTVELTENGKILQSGLERGFMEIQTAISHIHKRTHEKLITICVSTTMSSFYLMPVLPEFREQHPDVDFSLMVVTRDLNPTAESADFAIRLGDGNWKEFDSWKMFDEIIYPMCSHNYVAQAEYPLSGEAITQMELLHLDERFRPRIGWQEFFSELNIPIDTVAEHMKFSDHQPLLEAAMRGQGVILGWAGVTDRLVESGLLWKPTNLKLKTNEAFYLVAPKGVPLTPQAKAFKDWLLTVNAKHMDS